MLKNRNFLLLWLVNITTTLGIELFTVTILVTIFEQTASTLQAAGVMVARTLPSFLLGPVAGVLVDRFSRKNVLIGMDIARLLLIASAVWLLQGAAQVSVLGSYLLVAGLSAADAFHRPARLALIPSFVSRQVLVQANSFILASNQIIMAVSYTLGGWLILSIALRQISLMIVALLATAIACGLLMIVPQRPADQIIGQVPSMWRSFLSGWHYLRDHPIARPLTIMETIEHLPHGIWTGALLLAFTAKALQGDPTDWGYQVTGYFSGMILGSLIALAIGSWLRRYPGWIIIANALGAGVLTLTYAGSQSILMAVVLAFVFGPPGAIRDVAQDSLLQGTVDDEQLGRVYATREMLRNVVLMFAGLFFAWLSDLVPIRLIYVSGGIIYILTGLYALSSRALRHSAMPAASQTLIVEKES